MWDPQFVVFISPWSTRASYHYKLLVPHSHLGHISSPMESPVFGHHISLDNSLPEGEGKDLGNSDKLYLQCLQLQDVLPRSCTMIFATALAKIWVRCLESLARPLKTRKGHFDLMLQHCICYHGTIYCPFKVLASKISVRLLSAEKTPIGSFQKLFVVSVRHFCNKKVLMNKNIFFVLR